MWLTATVDVTFGKFRTKNNFGPFSSKFEYKYIICFSNNFIIFELYQDIFTIHSIFQ